MELYLGIDGGGTRTRAVLVDAQGLIHGEGEAGAANYNNIGLPAAVSALQAASEAAWRDAGRAFGAAAFCHAGLAGAKSSLDFARLSAALESARLAPPGRLSVTNDLHNALSGGLAGQPGIALIAGTGSNCLGRNDRGDYFMCGGWGWLLDDEGSATGLALAALRAAVRSADRRSGDTALLNASLAFFGLNEANEILAALYTSGLPVDKIASFAPVVTRLANEGDAQALAIIDAGARALAELVATTSRELAFPDQAPAVVLLGGSARSGAPYQPKIEAAIRDNLPKARIVDPVYEPHWGAAFNALQQAGLPLPSRLRWTRS